MSRSHISIKQLQEIAWEHISYEIEMFEYSGSRLVKGIANDGERNAMLETFLLHARCLYDFLYPSEKIRKDDVLADDFFDDLSELRKTLPQRLAISSYLNRRTGKEVAHITYTRLKVGPMQKQWQVPEVHNQIGEAMAIFFETLTEEKRGWFRKVYVKRC